MDILNQPFEGSLGDVLKEKLKDPHFKEFMFIVAFVKNSGILRLKEELTAFKSRGGRIKAFVGVDLGGTSYEGIHNLLSLCDELNIVHAKNTEVTFHPKIYILKSNEFAWVSIGSNNMTGGGLWSNIESCFYETLDIRRKKGKEILSSIESILVNDDFQRLLFPVKSTNDIELLLDEGYIQKEGATATHLAQSSGSTGKQKKGSQPFGRIKVRIPSIRRRVPSNKDHGSQIDVFFPENFGCFWFETGKMTGGSRNILDLSKTGRILSGETELVGEILAGGVSLFGIDPEDSSATKDITINYDGADYYGNSIFYSNEGKRPNLSWRIQLKGESPEGNKLSTISKSDFVNKILVFEKIEDRQDYYAVSVLGEENLDIIFKTSIVVASSGSNQKGRKYGILRDN